MQKLFLLRKKPNIPDWKKASINRVLKKHKQRLIDIFNSQERGTIQRQLNPDDLAPKNVISLFESDLTRSMGIKAGELTEDLIMVEFYFYQVLEDLIHQGFYHKGEKYVYFSSSAGNLRQHKGLFVKESKYKQIMPKLMGGLSIEEINEKGSLVTNKFLAYLALCNSATDVWEDFDIRKSIVIDDFTTTVRGLCDCIDSTDYSITKKMVDVEIPVTDGAGMMAHGTTCVVRAPWIKGLMVHFDFIQFLKEQCTPEQYVVTDIWGAEHNVIEEDIQYIFTKSQIKLNKFYSSWADYQDRFEKNGCEMCRCNVEKQYVPKARLNYQMLQSLSDMTDAEIQSLVKDTNKDIELIGNDYQTTLRLLGADEGASNKNYFQEAVGIYPELFRDAYSKEVLKQTKKSLVKQGKSGRLRVNGYYRFVSPDWYGVCENLFMGVKEPKGLLADGEVSINQFRDGDELDCLRSPHLYFEHVLRKNVINEDTQKWFDTKCIYTSSYDLISRILAFD